ncbi:FAD-dependent monooxygenase [Leucobacter sp. wl10]|uniref:FAD-dependent monooxygenase n=1 Tax=Leucobacter sp. wl10 TaxID=2304677 RepID=UPI000E5B99BD|nr:FAD-dependent monooxygenase [Leucobacter sp. wl10]RGE18959.1 hypothetical protein D1J51_13405 [Leucobacter sp. wl10]
MPPTPANRTALLDPLDPGEWPEEIPVLIVGGGPVGLSSAILLAQRGIETLLVERRSFESRFPRAHLLNVRTMEIFDEMGVADDIYALSPADENWRKVAWYTSVAGPSPEHGLKLGEVPAWGGGVDAVRHAQASPRAFANLPQIRLDGLLWAHAEAVAPGRIRAFHELTGVEQADDAVVATILDRGSGETRRIRARYLVAADGGRVSAELLGVEREGPKAIQDVISCYVSTDLSFWEGGTALLTHSMQPSGNGRPVGALQALGPHYYDRRSPEWLVARVRRGGEEVSDDEATQLRGIRRMLGVSEDHPITLQSVSHWQYEGVVADRFRVGRAFLAGDAAHRHPPTGGLGLNGGVQDAHNLAWKLAAVLRGEAPASLLDSYEWERRPVAAHNTAHSLENAGRHGPIGAALGLGPGVGEAEGWKQIEIFASDTAEGERRRAAVEAAVLENTNDYSQLNVEAGFAYVAGALLPEEGSEVLSGSPTEFRPSARPGSHLPHLWLQHARGATPTAPVSTLDLVDPRRLTLLVSEGAAGPWAEAVAGLAGTGVPVVLRPIDERDSAWRDLCEVDAGGAVLVRPDRKVAWRTRRLPGRPRDVLEDVRRTVMAGGRPCAEDPAAPFMRRIRDAAAALSAAASR